MDLIKFVHFNQMTIISWMYSPAQLYKGLDLKNFTAKRDLTNSGTEC